jgi:predicted DNA-binding transcriptional regulator YafY
MSTRLERIARIDMEIRAGHYPNAQSLSAQFEVSKRTIYDDRTFMVDRLGAPINFDKDKGGWYYTNLVWVLPGLMVTEGEFLAFILGLVAARQYLGTPYEAPLRSALHKIARSLPGHIQVNVDEILCHYTFTTGGTVEINTQLMLDLNRAIQKCRQVEILYYTIHRNKEKKRVINPYHLHNVRGVWYLLAYDCWREMLRTFHLGRVKEWRVLDELFQPDPNFSARKQIAQGFLTEMGPIFKIAIRFDEYLER